MLILTVKGGEFWNEETEEMTYGKDVTLRLEHSLISISKWEAKWCIPFFDSEKTAEQSLDYIKCMTIDVNVNDSVFDHLSMQNVEEINAYIAAPMTATTINSVETAKSSGERVTSELIYYWMVAYQIPWECEKWHINRLIVLIRVCSEKNKPAKKMSKKDIMRQNKALNAARRARLNSRG